MRMSWTKLKVEKAPGKYGSHAAVMALRSLYKKS